MSMKDQDWSTKRLSHIQALNKRIERLDSARVRECKKAIQQSYDAASIIKHVSVLCKEEHIQKPGLRSIGLRSTIKLTEFNDSTYYWGPYFSDVGRAIARGERKYLHERIGRRVTGSRETISRSNPNFSILTERIKHLDKNNLDPDTLLAPIRIFVDFVKFYGSSIDWTHGRPEQLLIDDFRLKVFWSHKYAQLNSFVIFNSKAGIWHVIPDQETGGTLTIALGESDGPSSRVEYWVETLAWYQILDTNAFCRINLCR